MKKKIISLILISSINASFISSSFAETSDFKEHEKRVNNICKGDNSVTGKFVPIVKKMGEYREAGKDDNGGTNDLETAKGIYRENMNNIYKCGLLKVQMRGIENIKTLIDQDTTGTLKILVETKLDSQKQKLEIKRNSLCKNEKLDEKAEDKIEILNNVTQETCIYTSYLEYLKKYYENTANLAKKANNEASDSSINKALDTINGVSSINGLNTTYNNIIKEVANEEDHATRLFPIALQSYLEYESNYVIHILLEILRDDYIVFREKLNSVINPINQLVYKISNAMKK